MSDQVTWLGIDFASMPDRTVIVLPPLAEEIDPEFVAKLRSMESVELIIQESMAWPE